MSAEGLIIGKNAGTIIAVAKLLSRLKVVKFWILPPNLPAIIGAAVAVGIRTHKMIDCAIDVLGDEALKPFGDRA